MTDRFFERPILNSPYECPEQHWELDKDGQPTNQILKERRRAQFITPIPKPKKRRGSRQTELVADAGEGVASTTRCSCRLGARAVTPFNQLS